MVGSNIRLVVFGQAYDNGLKLALRSAVDGSNEPAAGSRIHYRGVAFVKEQGLARPDRFARFDQQPGFQARVITATKRHLPHAIACVNLLYGNTRQIKIQASTGDKVLYRHGFCLAHREPGIRQAKNSEIKDIFTFPCHRVHVVTIAAGLPIKINASTPDFRMPRHHAAMTIKTDTGLVNRI
jgi:hypothetical protein